MTVQRLDSREDDDFDKLRKLKICKIVEMCKIVKNAKFVRKMCKVVENVQNCANRN